MISTLQFSSLLRAHLLVAAALLGACVPALAHVSLEQNTATAGKYHKLTFRVGHGCQGSATHTLTVAMPEGMNVPKPMPKTGWSIVPASAGAREVTWKGGPLPDGWFDEFSMMVKLPDTPGRYYFKVAQLCENGRMDWAELPGVTAVTMPAPFLDVQGAAGAVPPAASAVPPAAGAVPAAGAAKHH